MKALISLCMFGIGLHAADVHQLIQKHCISCHGEQEVAADVDLRPYTDDAAFRADFDFLDTVIWMVEEGEMPPSKAPPMPLAERQAVVTWGKALMAEMAAAQADDPGPVVMPRLTGEQFDRVVSDLAGLPLSQDGIIPPEGGAGEGFANVGAAQAMTTVHLEGFIAAVDYILRHLRVGMVSGLHWERQPQALVTTVAERAEDLRERWLRLHRQVEEALLRHPSDQDAMNARYLAAAWRWAFQGTLPDHELVAPAVESWMRFMQDETSVTPQLAELKQRWAAWSEDSIDSSAVELVAQFDAWSELLREDRQKRRQIRKEDREAQPGELLSDAQRKQIDQTIKLFWHPNYTAEGRGRTILERRFLAKDATSLRLPTDQDWGRPWHLPVVQLEAYWQPEERAARAALLHDWQAEVVQRPAVDAVLTAHWPAIVDFAKRAWRQAPDAHQIRLLRGVIRQSLEKDATVDVAIKQALKLVLLAPQALYRMQATGSEHGRLSPRELADRLAFGIWGSIPDARLLAAADSGALHDDKGLQREMQRLLEDDRSQALVHDFLAHWLDFAGFDEHSGPVDELFPMWDHELRQAMYDELHLFSARILRENLPLRDFLDSDWTYLNARLAKHYDITGVNGTHMRVVQLDPDSPRGGLPGMGALLTRTSRPERTSPVLRGTWLVAHVLDQPMPEPPADVPPLSQNETDEQGRSIPEQLAEHRDNPACASCHVRLDPPGLNLERFDAIGRWRDSYRSGEPVDDQGGIDQLRQWLLDNEEDFLRAFCRKFLGYSLGRGLQPSDQALLEAMYQRLLADETRPHGAMLLVFESPQFRSRRVDAPALSRTDD